MRFAPVLVTLSLTSIALVVACTGGGGTIEQSGDNGDQSSGVTKDPGSGQIIADLSSSGLSSTSSSSGRSSTSGTVYTPQPDLHATDYNTSCNQDSDCQQIYEGPVCTQCVYTCQNAAIASTDFSKWSSDRTSRYSKCDPSLATNGGGCSCDNGGGKRAYCDASKRCVYGVKPTG